MTTSEGEVRRLLALDEARARALVEVDIDTLDRVTEEAYVHVESSGKRRTKTEFIDGLRKGISRFERFIIDENVATIYGDTAVLTGRYHTDIRTAEGLQPTKHARHMRVYARRGEGWINVAHQATAIVAPASGNYGGELASDNEAGA